MSSLNLRGYQKACIESTLDNLRNKNYQQLVWLPTGCGKTVIFSNLIPLIPSPSPQTTKVLVLVHRLELLTQVQAQILRFNPTLNVEIEQDTAVANVGKADVIVASVQSLSSATNRRLKKFDATLFKAVIVDEAHHGVAKSYMSVFKHFGALQDDSKILLWGCTATVNRKDKVPLEPVFGNIVYQESLLTMIRNGYLCDFQVSVVNPVIELNQQAFYRLVIDSWKEYALLKGRKSTLLYVKNKAQCESLCEAFIQQDIDARFVHSQISNQTRSTNIQDFALGRYPILINCQILTEGVDIPAVDCIMIARDVKSQTLTQQIIGRGSRLHDEKTDCHIIDFKSNFKRFAHQLNDPNQGVQKPVVSRTALTKLPRKPRQDLEESQDLGKSKYDQDDITAEHCSSLAEFIAPTNGSNIGKPLPQIKAIHVDQENASSLVEKLKEKMEELAAMILKQASFEPPSAAAMHL